MPLEARIDEQIFQCHHASVCVPTVLYLRDIVLRRVDDLDNTKKDGPNESVVLPDTPRPDGAAGQHDLEQAEAVDPSSLFVTITPDVAGNNLHKNHLIPIGLLLVTFASHLAHVTDAPPRYGCSAMNVALLDGLQWIGHYFWRWVSTFRDHDGN